MNNKLWERKNATFIQMNKNHSTIVMNDDKKSERNKTTGKRELRNDDEVGGVNNK